MFEHKYKLTKSHCDCSYCKDPHASKHRREKNKVEIEREFANYSRDVPLLLDFDMYKPKNFYKSMSEIRKMINKRSQSLK
jgi:hypothetical protein